MCKMKLGLILCGALAVIVSPVHAAEIDYFEQAASGGIIVIITVLLSILALACAGERFLRFTRKVIAPQGLLKQVKPLWEKGDFENLSTLLKQNDSTLSRIVQFMVSHREHGREIISTGTSDIASMELRHHQQKAYPLAVIATIAPILGLLGTVIGMIEAFHVVASSGALGNPAELASGISKALTTTAAGLIVALPSLGLHHFFKSRTVFYSLILEKQVNDLIGEWFSEPEQAKGKAAA